MRPNSEILEKIEKLLALAHKASGASEAEQDTARNMAQAMMDKYGLQVNQKKYETGDIDLAIVPEATTAQREAMRRVLFSISFANYATILNGFMDRGIDQADIIPRKNIFTFDAWKAIGRFVRKGEKGLKIRTWKPVFKKDEKGKPTKNVERFVPGPAWVFHQSQTDALKPEYSGLID